MQFTSPLVRVKDELLISDGLSLWMKRDDLLPGPGHGNKFRKLKYQIAAAKELGADTLITFGGAYSNHLYAVAGVGRELGFNTIGFVRGAYEISNSTTDKLKSWGMRLFPLSRDEYRTKDSHDFLEKLRKRYPTGYVIPEGGSASLALEGVGDMVEEVRTQHPNPIDYWVCPFATGATLAGIVENLRSHEKAIGCMVLKGLRPYQMIRDFTLSPHLETSVSFETAHYGRFGKRSTEIERFIIKFYETHGICLDPIYTGKMMMCLFRLISETQFKQGSTIVCIHTGGLQGSIGYNARYGTGLPVPDYLKEV